MSGHVVKVSGVDRSMRFRDLLPLRGERVRVTTRMSGYGRSQAVEGKVVAVAMAGDGLQSDVLVVKLDGDAFPTAFSLGSIARVEELDEDDEAAS